MQADWQALAASLLFFFLLCATGADFTGNVQDCLIKSEHKEFCPSTDYRVESQIDDRSRNKL